MSVFGKTAYRRCTINTVIAAALVGIGYLAAVVYAAVVDAPTHPIYGAAGFLTLGLSLFAGFLVAEDRRAARQKQPVDVVPILVEEIDNAPTVAVGRHPVDPRVPAQRSRPRVYHCPPDGSRAAMTVEMVVTEEDKRRLVNLVADAQTGALDMQVPAAADELPAGVARQIFELGRRVGRRDRDSA